MTQDLFTAALLLLCGLPGPSAPVVSAVAHADANAVVAPVVNPVVAPVVDAYPNHWQVYVVVVNEENPVESLTQEEVSRIFLKKTPRWPSGRAIAVVEPPRGSDVREAFADAVHGRSASAIQSYWQQQIFAGREVPPLEKGSEAELLAYVRTNPDAIGYVAAGTPLGPGVRAVPVR